MISYKKALELKEFGFPQTWREGMSFYYEDGELMEQGCEDHGNDTDALKGIKVPFFEEVIEQLGEKFGGILSGPRSKEGIFPGSFMAFESFWMIAKESSRSFQTFIKGERTHGSTPLEAVVNLYIALNKKS